MKPKKPANGKRTRELLELQVLEYIGRYPPGLGDVSVEIKSRNSMATVRSNSRETSG